jgi:hypothetical protein
MKGKVVEAMRFGVPIVTTPFGVQGMTQLAAKLPVHSEPALFADAVFTLLTDDAAWLTQRRIQREYVRRHFCLGALRDFLLADLGSARRTSDWPTALGTGRNFVNHPTGLTAFHRRSELTMCLARQNFGDSDNRRTRSQRSDGVTNAVRARMTRTQRPTDPALGGVTLTSATVILLRPVTTPPFVPTLRRRP